MPLLQVPRTRYGVLGRGEQIQELLLLCKKCQVMDRATRESSMRRKSSFPLQGPAGPHCFQQAEHMPPLLAEGRRGITARSQDPSTCGDVRAPELSTHKLNCLTHSSSIPSLTAVRAILVPTARQEHSTRTWLCLQGPCIRGISSHSLQCLTSTGNCPPTKIPRARNDQLGPGASLMPLSEIPAAKTAQ